VENTKASMSLHDSIIQVAICAVQMIREAAKALANLNNQSRPCSSRDAVQIDCIQLQLQLEVDVAKTMSWYSLWFMETDNSDDLFQALWGRAGHGAILHVLQCIKKECKSLTYAVEISSAQLDAQVRKSKPKRTNSWKKVQKLLHLSTKWTANSRPSNEIHDDIHTLTGYVDELWEESERHFRRLHGVPRGLFNRPDTKDADGRVERALATRSATSALYWSLQSCATGIDLELNLLNHDQEFDVLSDLVGSSDLKLSYHMQLEVRNQNKTKIDFVADLYDDHQFPELNTLPVVEDVMLLGDPGRSDRCSKFVLRRPSTIEHIEVSFFVQIKDDVKSNANHPVWLDTMDSTSVLSSSSGVDLSSVEAKMTLAYRVVESSLYLLGTPWLSHLNSEALRASKVKGLDQRYSLHISTSSLKAISDSSFLQAEPAQIFQVGIVLVEIALGQRMLADIPTLAPKPVFVDHIAAIEETMGVPYKQACEFCLMQEGKGAWELNAEEVATSLVSTMAPEPVEMISLFYSEVFMR
jgi:hypothetical protein